MLRELYVAVTRARRRVVISVQRGNVAMKAFFDNLDYRFQETGAEMILREFDMKTSSAEWRKKGLNLFEDQQYKVAARCFEAAGDSGWSYWSYGRYFHEEGDTSEAFKSYTYAMVDFHARENHERVLDKLPLSWSVVFLAGLLNLARLFSNRNRFNQVVHKLRNLARFLC